MCILHTNTLLLTSLDKSLPTLVDTYYIHVKISHSFLLFYFHQPVLDPIPIDIPMSSSVQCQPTEHNAFMYSYLLTNHCRGVSEHSKFHIILVSHYCRPDTAPFAHPEMLNYIPTTSLKYSNQIKSNRLSRLQN